MNPPNSPYDNARVSDVAIGFPRKWELRRVFSLSIPIFGGQISNALAGLIDVIMIGYLGTGAVAAVGFGVLVFFILVSLTIGIESATQTLCARRKGEGRTAETGKILSEALRLSIVAGLPMGIALALTAPTIMHYLHSDPVIQNLGSEYLAARALSLPFVMSIAAFRGFHNGTSRPKLNLVVACVILLVQVIFNWLLIFGALGFPELGVLGAGISASIAYVVGLLMFLVIARKDNRHGVFQTAHQSEQKKQIRGMLFKLGLPSGLQWALSWIAMLIFLYFAGQVGVVEADASYLLIQIMSLLTLTANSFGFSAASLVSQALGENDPERARRWGLITGGIAAGLLGLVGIGLSVFSIAILSALNNDVNLVAIAYPILVICGLVCSVDALGIVMNFALIGAGEVRRVMIWNLTGMWFICLPLAWIFGVKGANGMLGLWVALLGARLFVAIVMYLSFQQGRWFSQTLVEETA